MECAAALVLPRAGHRGDRERRMHVDRAVALAGEAVAEPEVGPFRRADKPGEGFDLLDRKAGDRRGPFGRAGREMGLQSKRVVCVLFEIGAVGKASRKSTCMTAQASAPSVPGLRSAPCRPASSSRCRRCL